MIRKLLVMVVLLVVSVVSMFYVSAYYEPEYESGRSKVVPLVDKYLNKVLLFKASWSGMHVATMMVELSPEEVDGQAYEHVNVSIKTHGLLKWATNYKSKTAAKIFYSGERYLPYNYKTWFKYRKKSRTIVMEYASDGQLSDENNTPHEKRWKRKEVPVDLKTNSFDPLTLVLEAREKIKRVYEKDEIVRKFTIPLYDGRRRSDQVLVVSKELVDGLIKVVIEEIPIAGYTDNELKELSNDPLLLEIYVSPETYIPQKAKGQMSLGSAWLTLDKICDSVKQCRL